MKIRTQAVLTTPLTPILKEAARLFTIPFGEVREDFGQSVQATFGDASYTLVDSDTVVNALRDAISQHDTYEPGLDEQHLDEFLDDLREQMDRWGAYVDLEN